MIYYAAGCVRGTRVYLNHVARRVGMCPAVTLFHVRSYICPDRPHCTRTRGPRYEWQRPVEVVVTYVARDGYWKFILGVYTHLRTKYELRYHVLQ